MIDLPLIWALIIAFAVFAYVVMDGFDLGIGILFPSLKEGKERNLAVNSIAPVWDGNETWLVMGGGGLLAVFPLAYAVIMPAVYAPIIAMLCGLIFRGVAFEFRGHANTSKKAWDFAFFAGSVVAALSQGIVLGALLQGVVVEERSYAGGWWDWLSPFSILCGVSVTIGYALLGAGWLILKTEGELQEKAYRYAWPLTLLTVLGIGAVSVATPFLRRGYFERWFEEPNIYYTSLVPLLVCIVTAALFVALRAKKELAPFLFALALFALSYIGLAISLYPYIVPGEITIWDAAAPPESQGFLLVGALVLVPIILIYTAYSYYVFRGKVTEEHYH